MSAVADDVKPGDLVGWKFRAAMVMGRCKDVSGDKLTLSPISHPDSTVVRKREKVILASELDQKDVDAALNHGGHIARKQLVSHGEKAERMGLTEPHQLMPEKEAHEAKAEREKAYKEEAAERGSKKRSGKKGREEEKEGAAEEHAPATPSKKGGAKRGQAEPPSPVSPGKAKKQKKQPSGKKAQ